MAETLGSLCDKLTIVKLKEWHSADVDRLSSLAAQCKMLQNEIDDFVLSALAGETPVERLSFAANKVYKKQGNELAAVPDGIGNLVAELAKVNCELWHEQEKVYEFETVPPEEKNRVVKMLALLNLRRNQCIDGIDKSLIGFLSNRPELHS